MSTYYKISQGAKLAFFSLIFVQFILLGCISSGTTSKDRIAIFKKSNVVGVLINIDRSDKSQYFQEIIKDYLTSHSIQFFIENTQREKIGIRSAFQRLQSNKVDVLVVIQNKEFQELIYEISPTSIPVVYYYYQPSSDMLSTYQHSAVVAPDNEKIGRMQAQFLIQSLLEQNYSTGNIGLITGSLDDLEQGMRSKGFREYIQNNSELNISQSQSANWAQSEATALVEQWIQNDTLRGIAANDDAMILGASIPLREQDISNIRLVGADGTKKALQYISKDYIDATVYLDNTRGFELVLNTAARMLQNFKFNTFTEVPAVLVDSRNIAEYYSE